MANGAPLGGNPGAVQMGSIGRALTQAVQREREMRQMKAEQRHRQAMRRLRQKREERMQRAQSLEAERFRNKQDRLERRRQAIGEMNSMVIDRALPDLPDDVKTNMGRNLAAAGAGVGDAIRFVNTLQGNKEGQGLTAEERYHLLPEDMSERQRTTLAQDEELFRDYYQEEIQAQFAEEDSPTGSARSGLFEGASEEEIRAARFDANQIIRNANRQGQDIADIVERYRQNQGSLTKHDRLVLGVLQDKFEFEIGGDDQTSSLIDQYSGPGATNTGGQ